ncbi:hypothetical protein FRB99_000236 [Tulasnella sp. 403]|nr:hypothetical protein FRB99_000236 [Tulasnella sp. 403]
MLADSVIGGGSGDGDEPPKVNIQLDAASQVTAKEMECFVQLLDTRIFQPRPGLTFQQWSSSLHLATMWHFDQVREFIIESLDNQIRSIDPLDRIDVAIKCSVEKWLVPAYVALCTQEQPLSDSVGHRLGIVRFAALCRIRERRLQAERPRPTPPPSQPVVTLRTFGQPSPAPTPGSLFGATSTVVTTGAPAVSVPDLIKAEPALAFPRTAD